MKIFYSTVLKEILHKQKQPEGQEELQRKERSDGGKLDKGILVACCLKDQGGRPVGTAEPLSCVPASPSEPQQRVTPDPPAPSATTKPHMLHSGLKHFIALVFFKNNAFPLEFFHVL